MFIDHRSIFIGLLLFCFCSGASYASWSPPYWGQDAPASEDGGDAYPNGGRGGKDGHGGAAPYSDSNGNGGGGGGWKSNGRCLYSDFCGLGRPGGFEGGEPFGPDMGYYEGGFGGGSGTRHEGEEDGMKKKRTCGKLLNKSVIHLQVAAAVATLVAVAVSSLGWVSISSFF